MAATDGGAHGLAFHVIALLPPRPALRRRIESRFAAMLAAGAVEEVRALAALGLSRELPAMKAHGVPEVMRHLSGEITLEEQAGGAAGRPAGTPSVSSPGCATRSGKIMSSNSNIGEVYRPKSRIKFANSC